MIKFQKVRYKNFLGTGNAFTEIDLSVSPVTLVFGANGAGKSTMMCAICMALFGKPFRKINKPQLLNSINGRELVVEVEFKIGRKQYLVRRGIKPNVFEIFCNDELVNQESKNVDYQKMLEQQILKMNYKTFTQVVILGSAKFVPFMQLSAADRRAIIEDLLDIQVFTTMNNILKNRIVEVRDHITAAENDIRIQNDRIEVQKKYVDNLKRDKSKLIEQYDKKIELCDGKLEKCKSNIIKVKEKISKLEKYTNQIESVADKIGVINTKITKLQTQRKIKIDSLDFFYGKSGKSCPTCKQSLDDSHCNSMIEDHLKVVSELDNNISKLQELLNKQTLKLKQLNKILTQSNQWSSKLNELNAALSAVNDHKSTLIKEREKLQSEYGSKNIDDEQIKLEEYNSTYKDLRKDKDHLVDERHNYDIVSLLLKDSGIKTKIISQYLPIMNQTINKYLTMLDFAISFELNENFEETIKSRYRDDFSYNSFSEGEKQRIDLALLFAWRDIAKMRNSANTNLLILDEVFDSSLDFEGTESFMRLLKALDSKTNTFIITHHGDALYDKFDTTIEFAKSGNFSVIKSMNLNNKPID